MLVCGFPYLFNVGSAASETGLPPEDLVLSPTGVLENQAKGSIVGTLRGIDVTRFHRNTLLHQGFVLDVAEADFLDLHQNAGLGTHAISGERNYSGALRFNSVGEFRKAGVGISRNRGFQNLFAGYFRAKEDGIYEFQLKRSDDGSAIWIDLDQDGTFEQDTYTKERVSDVDEHRSVYLKEGLYMYAVPHVQGHGGAVLEVEFRTPSSKSGAKTFSTVDPSDPVQDGLWFLEVRNPEADLTYKLAKGNGDDDNKLFEIQGDKLLTKAVFDHEARNSYSVRIEVTNAEGLDFERPFEIEVINANDPFTAIELDESTVEENLPPGTLVGELAATDPDGVPTKGLNKGLVAYYPFDGTADDQTRNKNHGTLKGGAKLTEDRFGRDNAALYMDGNGDWVDINGVADNVRRSVTMATWVQADPANSGTRRSILAVNSALGEQGGSLGGSNILLLLIGRRSSDLALTRKFVIFDAITGGYEAMSQTDVADGLWHHIAYTTDGEVGNFFVDGEREGSHATDYQFEANFRWSLGQEFDNANASDFLKGLLDDVRIYNRILSDGEIKALYETYTYRLVPGEGDDDNANFKILSNMLQTQAQLDYESQGTHSIRVEVSDTDGQSFEQVFQIQVTDTNDAPLGISLGPDTIAENLKKGSTIGKLAAIDPDTGDRHTFSLAKDPGEGYSNEQFTLSGQSLRSNAPLDFENQSEHRLLIEVRDRAGATFRQDLLVKVADANDAPTAVTIDNTAITETAVPGTPIGTLTATDPDAVDAHTFKITGGADKSFFKIDTATAQLQLAKPIDYEFQDRLNVTVRATDNRNASVDQDLEILVLDANDAPTDLLLEPAHIGENRPAGTIVGTFRQSDPDGEYDPLDTGETTEPTEFFNETFPGNKLNPDWTEALTNADAWTYEVNNNRLQVQGIQATIHNTDAEGQWGIATLTRPITPLADFTATVELAWDQNGKAEATQEMFVVLLGPDDELIASVGIYDEWIRYKGVKFTSLAENDYMTSIDTLSHKATADTVKVTRWGKEVDVRWNDWLFATGKSDIPLAKVQLVFGTYPATINRLDTTYGEQSVKRIHIAGIEAPKAPRYELVQGEGAQDNALFSIQGTRLLAGPSFNFEDKESCSIRVRGIDPGELALEKIFTIDVLDLNDPPRSISLDNATVAENLKKGVTVGNLAAVDEDQGDRHTFKLPGPQDGGNPDNSYFSLSGNRLRTTATFDFEDRSLYNLRVRVTDTGGAVLEQDLAVQVTGRNDAPSHITLSASSVAEGLPAGHVIGTLGAIDPDPGDTHTFKIVGGRDARSFSVQDDQLRTAATYDREARDTLEVTLRATDTAKAYTDHTFTITVDNANDAPTSITLSNLEVPEAQPAGTRVGTLGTTDPDAVPLITLPLHLHILEDWELQVGNAVAASYVTTKDFTSEILPAINAHFTAARIHFELGRTHTEDLRKRFADDAAMEATADNLLSGRNLPATIHALMDPALTDPGSFHLYLLPYAGKGTIHLDMKAHHGHAAAGQWSDAPEGGLRKTDLPLAAIQALSAVLGTTGQGLNTANIQALRAQAARGRPAFNAPTAPTLPLRTDAAFAKLSVPAKEYHLQMQGANLWVPYASNHPISETNASIRRIVLLTQGVDNELTPAWNTLSQGIFDEALNERTLLIAPQFLREDQLATTPVEGLLHWPSQDAQLYGGLSTLVQGTTNTAPKSTTSGKKIDLYHKDSDYPAYPEKGRSELVTEFVKEMKKEPAGFAFLHLTHPDSVGHGHGWGTDKYHNSIRAVDADLSLLFDLVENDERYKGKTVLLLTADHGGGGGRLYEHTTATHPLNFTIPFYAWGKGVSTGTELYALNSATRTAPAASENPPYSGESAQQPIRNGAIANLAAKLLGLAPVPGSWINARQDLSIGSSNKVEHVIAISIDGLRPGDIAELGAAELPQLFRFRTEGVYTDNARTDVFLTRTIPNHSSMMTGRGALDVTGVGTGHNQIENHDGGGTLHENIGAYMHSIFDLAKAADLRTALFANKSKFALFERTWDGTWQAPDHTGQGNGEAPRTTTFAVLDHILEALTTDKNQYPNLEEVVLAGHGDGANLLQRYAASNHFEPRFRKNRKLPIRYVLLAPDSYMYFTRERRAEDGTFTTPATPPDKFNDYPFGTNYLFEYPQSTGIDALLDNYPVRQVAYLVGEQDNGDTGDTSPAAMIQGLHRLDRAQAYDEHLRQVFGPTVARNHSFTSVPATSYHAAQMLKAGEVRSQILGISVADTDGDGFLDADERALTTDPLDPDDQPSTFTTTFELINGDGDQDNFSFQIQDGQLLTNGPLDHENQEHYKIRVRVTDPGGLTFEQPLSITATDVNEPPTGIAISSATVAENLKKGTRIGKLTATDPDKGDKLSFTLEEHEFFEVKGVYLYTRTPLDFEISPTYELNLTATDKHGLALEQAIEINVSDVNEPSLAIKLDNSSLPENAVPQTNIGTFSVDDPDAGDTFIFSLTKGEGDSDNTLFQVDKATGILASKVALNYEDRSLYSVRVRTEDAVGHKLEQTFAVTVTNVNEAPLSITIDNAEVRERKKAGTSVGTFAATDSDGADTHTFSLVDGEGATHNHLFEIVDNRLKTTAGIDGKSTPLATIRVRATDAGGLFIEQPINILVADAPDPPTDITLSANTLKMFERTGTEIGTFSATDPDADDSHTYALVEDANGASNELFFIDGDKLLSNHMFDDTASATYKIRVVATDSSALTYEETLTVQILNAANPGQHLVNVTREPADGGLVAGAGYYQDGETVKLSVKNSSGHTFSGHTGDVDGGFSAENPIEFTADADKSITSHFTEGYHLVTVGVTPERHGYAWGGGSVLHGVEITLRAKELDDGHAAVFSHWSINGAVQEPDANDPLQLKLEVAYSMQVLAHFDYGLDDRMKHVPAGTFSQGNPKYHGEKPVVTPGISAFYIDEHETTKADWYAVHAWAVLNGYAFNFDPSIINGRNLAHTDSAYKDAFPITGISWEDAAKWCNARSEMEGLIPAYYKDAAHTEIFRDDTHPGGGDAPFTQYDLHATMVDWRAKGYRLPTEAEWEKAARGGVTGLTYANSNTIDDDFAHFDQSTDLRDITEVGGKRAANGFGLYDMTGNAWEMCWDWHWKNWYFQADAAGTDPKGPDLSDPNTYAKVDYDNWIVRTVRGGSANSDKVRTRVSYRKDFNKTWFQYAITLRPIVPAPSDPYAMLLVKSSPSHLGSAYGGGIHTPGSTAQINAIARQDKSTFLHWEDADGNVLGTSASLDLQLATDMEVTAVFEDIGEPEEQLYTLQALSEPFGSGTVLGGGAYLPGTKVTLTAAPLGTNQFAGWSGDASGVTPTATIVVDGHKKVTAYFGNTARDTDEDGLSDLYERSLGTDPENEDTDDDGLSDGDEMNRYGSDPLKADSDDDGFTDKEEVAHGTDPKDPRDFPFLPKLGLALRYQFKSKAFDLGPGRHHGKVSGAVLAKDRYNEGKNAYQFSGNRSTITASGYKGIGGSAARTISLWLRCEPGASGGLLHWGSSSSEFGISIVGTNATIQADGITLQGSTDLLDGNWHQVVAVLPEGGSLNEATLYVDGKEEATTGGTNTALRTDSSNSLVVGRDAAGQHFNGYIDDIWIWSRNLAPGEVAKHFTAEEATEPPEPELIRPAITAQPVHTIAAEGAQTTFTVIASGKPEPTYQWQELKNRKWKDIQSATTSTLTLPTASADDAKAYRVIVRNAAGYRNSKTAKLSVIPLPDFPEQPRDLAFTTGATANLVLPVTGGRGMTYEWFKDGTSIGSTKSSKLTLRKVKASANDGTYSVKITNAVGEATSNEFQVSILDPVDITSHPTHAGIVTGEAGSLSITATGGGTLAYQWEKFDARKRQWIAVDGSNSATLDIATMDAATEGTYRCTVSNGPSHATSKTAILSLYIPPTFKTHPRSYSLKEYAKLTLAAEALGTPAPNYQWQKLAADGTTWQDINRATKPKLAFSRTYRAHAGQYRVSSTNAGGSSTSDIAVLTIYHAPILSTNLTTAQTLNEGAAATLTVAANALDAKGTSITYAWYKDKKTLKDGGNLTGAKTASLTLTAVTPGDAGRYHCVLKNGAGSTISIAQKLTVVPKPYATKPLTSLDLPEGKNVTFSASIRGGKPLAYQWQKNGNDLPGQTKNKLSLRAVTPQDAGTYNLIATNPAGTLELEATLTVTAAARLARTSATAVPFLQQALGSNPTTGEAFIPQIDTVEDGSGKTFLRFSYTENKAVTGTTYTLEHSFELKTWTPVDLGTTQVHRLDRGTYTEVTVYLPPNGNGGFFRMRVKQ